MEPLFRVQIDGVFEPFVDEIDLAKTALSCHFALGRYSRFCMTLHRAPFSVERSLWLRHRCRFADIEKLILWYMEQFQPGFLHTPRNGKPLFSMDLALRIQRSAA